MSVQLKVEYLSLKIEYRDVAQFGSAPRLGRGGRTFESCHPDHLKIRVSINETLIFLFLAINYCLAFC